MSYELATSFNTAVIEASHETPVLVDFWAPWCGPCQALGPVLEELAANAGDRWHLVKINTEAHPDVAQEYQIASIPAVKLFVKGQVVDEFNGALPEPQIRDWLEHALPSPHATALDAAREQWLAGQESAALETVQSVLEAEPKNEDAFMLQAEIRFPSDLPCCIESLDSIPAGSDSYDRAAALKVLAQHRMTATAPEGLPEGKGKAKLELGLTALSSWDYESALTHLIESIEQDRNYADQSALQVGKAVFQWIGIRHPVADRFYRRFTSVLYI